jgi:activating signal cointegrator complex subunit 1
MPTVPPRAAVTNANPTSPDDSHETNSPSDRKDKDIDSHHRKGKDGKDIVGNTIGSTGGGGSGTSPVRSVGIGSGTKGKQREAALQLRERDERIAHLEAEMTIMESEFTKELDRLSQNESETATFWQAKHSNLNQQYLRTDTELRLLRTEVDVRNAEREELRQEWDMLRRELKDRDDEIRSLRGQVRGLKEFVSTSTRTDGQTSDEVFVDGMTRLGNGLQNWVIVNFRRAKMGEQEPLSLTSSPFPTLMDGIWEAASRTNVSK